MPVRLFEQHRAYDGVSAFFQHRLLTAHINVTPIMLHRQDYADRATASEYYWTSFCLSVLFLSVNLCANVRRLHYFAENCSKQLHAERRNRVMKLDDARRRLIDGTIQVIAREGLDNATTKRIGLETSINQAYIYRCFKDKEDMFAKAFATLDDEFVAKAMQHIEVMHMQDMDYEVRCRFYFSSIWTFLLGNRDKCLTYIRYYYSPYFAKYSLEEHQMRFLPLVNKFRDAFHDKAEVWLILNHILNVMLDFAVKVYNGQMPNDEDHTEHVFRVVYRSIEQYFKTS